MRTRRFSNLFQLAFRLRDRIKQCYWQRTRALARRETKARFAALNVAALYTASKGTAILAPLLSICSYGIAARMESLILRPVRESIHRSEHYLVIDDALGRVDGIAAVLE